MKRQRREEIARAEMYDDGEANLVEYKEQYKGVRPGACDEYLGGGRARKQKESQVVAMRAPTNTTPVGPGHRLFVPLGGGKALKRVACRRCAGTGRDEGISVPCRKCKPFYDGKQVVRGTVFVPVTECTYYTLLKNSQDHLSIRR